MFGLRPKGPGHSRVKKWFLSCHSTKVRERIYWFGLRATWSPFRSSQTNGPTRLATIILSDPSPEVVLFSSTPYPHLTQWNRIEANVAQFNNPEAPSQRSTMECVVTRSSLRSGSGSSSLILRRIGDGRIEEGVRGVKNEDRE